MLKDDEFARSAAVDRYGRELPKDQGRKRLERFYEFDGEDEKDDEEEEEEDDDEEEVEETEVDSDDSVDDDADVVKELKRVEARKLGYDPAREGGFSGSESSSEESSSEEEDEEDVEDDADEEKFPDQTMDGIPLGEVTKRIAVVNLDWDNIRSEDLMAVFSSFVPSGGRLLNVTVYPSEFGKERIEREETEGPPQEIFAAKDQESESEDEFEGFDDEEEDEEDAEERIKKQLLQEDKGEEFDSAQLRRYQLERLRYYYAVLTFSTEDAAKAVYDKVDGTEYLSTANFFDLRFVPDDTDFDDDKPRDACDRIPDNYKPNEFVTDALQHSKVKLTWDADDVNRKEAQAKAFRGGRAEIDENDLKAYIGSDSSEGEESDAEVVDSTSGSTTKVSKKEEERQRMRALLGLSAEPAKKKKDDGPVGDMQITFAAGLSGEKTDKKSKSVFENEPIIEESTLEKYVRKERDRKQRRKDKQKAKREGREIGSGSDDDDDDDENAISAKTATADDAAEEDLGFDDPFFAEPSLDKASNSARRKEERLKRRAEREAEEAASAAQRAELELLMAEPGDGGRSTMKHFDMKEIEKAAKKKNKKSKSKGKKSEEELVDDFEMNTADPRFGALFENSEFAIDPSNPKFKGTPGMKQLLEEGRKRRREDDGDAELDGKDVSGKKVKGSQDIDVKKLVERVKGKSKAKSK